MLDYPISMLHVLETITPYDYHIIRAGLNSNGWIRRFASMLHVGPRLAISAQLRKANLAVG